jgi:hypothetical protein
LTGPSGHRELNAKDRDLEPAHSRIIRRLPKWAAAVLLGTVPLPGWGLLLLAIVMGVPDWKSRYDFWLGVAESSAPWFGPIIPVLRYPYFPAVLAVVGIIYLALVGYPGPSIIRHRIVPLVAWVLFAFSATAVAGTAVAGYFEFRCPKYSAIVLTQREQSVAASAAIELRYKRLTTKPNTYFIK